MRFHRPIKQLFVGILLFVFAAFMLSLAPYSIASSAYLGTETANNQSVTHVLPATVPYMWIQSATGFLPIEESLTVFLSRTLQPAMTLLPGFSNSDLNLYGPYLTLYPLPFFGLLYCFIRGRNVSIANAIPLGGHAPPHFS